MCGRFAVTTDPALLAEKIKAIDEASGGQERSDSGNVPPAQQEPAGPNYPSGPNYPASPNYPAGPNYNVAPTTTISTVVKRHTEPEDQPTRRVRAMRWGLIPPWVKTAADGAPDNKGPLLINARAETVTTSPAFRNSAKGKRCLIPMDGWYEWRASGDAGGKKAAKTPFYMFGTDGEPLFMAGLWTTWRPAEGSGAPSGTAPLLSCTIITTEAAGPLAEIHDRMPLTISQTDWDQWLDPDAPVDEGLLRGHGDLDRIGIRQVARLVNSVRNNGPELIEPAEAEPEQATLL